MKAKLYRLDGFIKVGRLINQQLAALIVGFGDEQLELGQVLSHC